MTWREVFGHEEPYEAQVDGIETVRETAADDGFVLVEGACGTGKTMLALTAGIDLVRDRTTKFERVLVLTSVKQQLRQFEEDLRTINRNLPGDHDPVSGVTLVGKADVCPYNLAGTGGIDDTNVYDRCEGLRERTRNLADSDATSAPDLVERARDQQTALGESASYLRAAGEPAPYAPDTSEYEDTEYCPFYAAYLADLPDDGSPLEAVPFDFADRGLIEPEDLVALSVEHGTCPHSMMGVILGAVEVVIGNYYHAFDPTTTESFTSAVLDESTFVVCDEAHMLEPRVRDLVSDRAADASLRQTEAEITRLLQPLAIAEGDGAEGGSGAGRGSADGTVGGPATGSGDGTTAVGGVSGPDTVAGDDATSKAETVRAELAEAEVTREELAATRSFVRELRDELDRRVTAHLDRRHGDWRSDLADLPDEEIPLRDPEDPQPDEISEWAEGAGHDGGTWVRAEAVGAFVGRVLDELEEEDKQRAAPGVGRTLANWYRLDHEGFFREIELERTWDDTQPRDSWRRAYNARLALHNCVPSGPIGDRLSTFGGGVLMSATLEPLDVLREVTGLDRIAEEEDRPVVERTYGLHFLEENRESFAVAAPKYTYDNRGPTPDPEEVTAEDPGDGNDVRRAYVRAVRAVASGPGNVLVGMPSYGEAEWMAATLRAGGPDKPVLLDESSTDAVTEDLKADFFAGEGKVLVTSLRGTLTEGVDYSGDRLRAAVVCGVPIINTSSPRTRAVRTAYDRAFGDGFRTALTVPAVRKARQAVGRVIRGPEETGVRVLLDERYARDSWDSVRDLVPDHEGFQAVSPDMLGFGLDRFWDRVEE
ncbi:ATP-dependent DNA helicase [Halobacteriales archaeon QS_8_69_26]|nr:MAG: ATP-dependent DNA helicase [Halobacteriales archaeon QS_8_69_26]